jgi:hypothetical protein
METKDLTLTLCYGYFKSFDYADVFYKEFESEKSIAPIDAANHLFNAMPGWAELLMNLRDSIVRVFGLQTSKKMVDKYRKQLRVGDMIGFFRVYDFNESEILMGEEDKHLDFITSIKIDNKANEYRLSFYTVVKFHNFFGKLYFMIIKPFHKLIMKTLLHRLAKKIK